MNYKCIIFDCDGILVDSEGISSTVLTKMANEYGAAIDLDYALDNFAGVSLTSTLKYIEKRIGKTLPEQFEKEFRTRTFEAFKTEIKPIKGIEQVLDQISVPFCVASSGPIEKIKLNLTTTGLIERFGDRIFSSYEVGSWKPDPEIFEHAAEQMGFKPEECAVIEDSIVGVEAGIKGGFDVFAFTNTKNQAEFKKLGAHAFCEMDELIELLGG